MARKKTQICVEVDGRLRQILEVVEEDTGRLILVICSAERFGRGPHGLRTKTHKVSIHIPKKSRTHSLIHMTQELEDGTTIERHTVTSAVMENSGFSHIYFRQCANLSEDRYLITQADALKKVQIVLCNFSSELESIVHSVAVGSSEASFAPYELPNVNVRVVRFRFFSIVIMFTVVGILPSHQEGTFIYNFTARPEQFSNYPRLVPMVEELMKGVSPQKCCDEFWFVAHLLLGGFVKRRITQEATQLGSHQRAYLVNLHGHFANEVRKFAPKARPAFVQFHVDERDWSFSGDDTSDEPDPKPEET